MAVQAQFGGGLAGFLPADDQMWALKDYGAGALLSATPGANGGYQYNCAGVVSGSGAQSELTCNGGCGGLVALPSRKRGREAELDQYVSTPSAALPPFPGMMGPALCLPEVVAPSRMVESAMTSTSGRPAAAAAAGSVADAVVAELCQQGAEIDALVRAECERLRAGLQQARKRQCQALVRAAAGAAAGQLREKEAELEAARRRAADLEERLRQAAAETQAWCGLARSHEAAAAGIRATLDQLLLRGAAGCGVGAAVPAEGFGDSDPAAADDAQSGFFGAQQGEPLDTAASPPAAAGKWACKACGDGEASVLLLPCRHLCLCKACEPRADACPVCFAVKNASIHVADH